MTGSILGAMPTTGKGHMEVGAHPMKRKRMRRRMNKIHLQCRIERCLFEV